MKKTYKIEVDCANCANLMEEAANKVEGVAKATVNFITNGAAETRDFSHERSRTSPPFNRK